MEYSKAFWLNLHTHSYTCIKTLCVYIYTAGELERAAHSEESRQLLVAWRQHEALRQLAPPLGVIQEEEDLHCLRKLVVHIDHLGQTAHPHTCTPPHRHTLTCM